MDLTGLFCQKWKFPLSQESCSDGPGGPVLERPLTTHQRPMGPSGEAPGLLWDQPKPGKYWSKKKNPCLGGGLSPVECSQIAPSAIPMETDVQHPDPCFQLQSDRGAEHWDAPDCSFLDCFRMDCCGSGLFPPIWPRSRSFSLVQETL